MTTRQLDRDALDAQNEGRGLSRVIVWAAAGAALATLLAALKTKKQKKEKES